MNSQHLLSASVAPVVLISACGLITLALYNRLGAILARIRAFHQQKIEVLEGRSPRNSKDQKLRLEMMDTQISKVTAKAKMIQKGLFCLLGSCLAFLLCSFFSGMSVLVQSFGIAALSSYVVGLTCFGSGLCWAVYELMHSLSPLEEESAYLETLTRQHELASLCDDELKFTNAA